MIVWPAGTVVWTKFRAAEARIRRGDGGEQIEVLQELDLTRRHLDPRLDATQSEPRRENRHRHDRRGHDETTDEPNELVGDPGHERPDGHPGHREALDETEDAGQDLARGDPLEQGPPGDVEQRHAEARNGQQREGSGKPGTDRDQGDGNAECQRPAEEPAAEPSTAGQGKRHRATQHRAEPERRIEIRGSRSACIERVRRRAPR